MSQNHQYIFSHDWFSGNIPNLTEIANHWRVARPSPFSILEIGSFEGKSTVWLGTHFKPTEIVCIDTWQGGADHVGTGINFEEIRSHFLHNTSMLFQIGIRVEDIVADSYTGLIQLNAQNRLFDFIYVDGSHTAKDVLQDLVLSYPLLKPGGIIYCDDYLWGYNDAIINTPKKPNPLDTPKLGIDAFANVYRASIAMPPMVDSNGIAFMRVRDELLKL